MKTGQEPATRQPLLELSEVPRTVRQAPPYLYKYRPSEEYDQSWILRDEIYCPSPATFNDPFDGKVNFHFDGTDEQLRAYARSSLMAQSPRPSDEVIDDMLETAIRENRLRDPLLINNHRETLQKVVDERGVFCLSSKCDDILMFAHYADKHRGYCLEFQMTGTLKNAQPVRYVKSYPAKSFWEITPGQIAEIMLLTKSKQWSYEREWRLFGPQKCRPGLYKCDEPLLTGIIFGCQMPTSNKQLIASLNERRPRPAKLYQALKEVRRFGLAIKPCTG